MQYLHPHDPIALVVVASIVGSLFVDELLFLYTQIAVAATSYRMPLLNFAVWLDHLQYLATVVAAPPTNVVAHHRLVPAPAKVHRLGTPEAPCIRQVLPTEVHLQLVELLAQVHLLGNHACNLLGLHLGPLVPVALHIFLFWSCQLQLHRDRISSQRNRAPPVGAQAQAQVPPQVDLHEM